MGFRVVVVDRCSLFGGGAYHFSTYFSILDPHFDAIGMEAAFPVVCTLLRFIIIIQTYHRHGTHRDHNKNVQSVFALLPHNKKMVRFYLGMLLGSILWKQAYYITFFSFIWYAKTNNPSVFTNWMQFYQRNLVLKGLKFS